MDSWLLPAFVAILLVGLVASFFIFYSVKTNKDDSSTPLIDPPAYSRDSMGRDEMAGWSPKRILANFVLLAICFSANHGAVTGCLGLASNRLGDTEKLNADLGTWQLGTLYLTYTLSAVFGAAHVVKTLGARNGLIAGLSIYCVYVSCFLGAAAVHSDSAKWPLAIGGAFLGGIGGGFLWTAQGAYFVKVSEAYSIAAEIPKPAATAYLGGIFAFFYTYEEVVMKLLASVIVDVLDTHWSWILVFIIYTAVSVVSVVGVVMCHNFPLDIVDNSQPFCYKVTSAVRLLSTDPKMKYMIPMNAAFGFTAAFLAAYVTGQVVKISVSDKYAGALIAIPPAIAALMSLFLGSLSAKIGKGPVLIGGSICFAAVGSIFIIKPGVHDWGWLALITVYVLMGGGRATFESTLRATFADFFSNDTDGAFANIIIQSGFSSTFAFFAFPHFECTVEGNYCVKYQDGTFHNVLIMELIIVVTSVLAILGYLRAAQIRRKEQALEEEKHNLYGNKV